MIKRVAILSFWILLAAAGVFLLFAGAKEKGEKLCKDVNVEITENAKQAVIDEDEIKNEIGENGGKAGVPINSIKLKQIESELKNNAWIEDVKLYFDNNQILQVKLKECEAAARIFTLNGNSFFIDSSGKYLPENNNIIVRTPVFTGFTSDKQPLSPPDSALLQSVKQVANFINSDSFWTAYVSQINITPGAEFQIIPIVGNQIINIGNAENLPDKFNRLYSFYRQVLSRTGINTYKKIDVRYKGQVVASKGFTDSTMLRRVNFVPMNITDSMMIQSDTSVAPAANTKDTIKTRK